MVRIDGVGHHFERCHRYYCIVVVVVVVVADKANCSEKKNLLRQKKAKARAGCVPPCVCLCASEIFG